MQHPVRQRSLRAIDPASSGRYVGRKSSGVLESDLPLLQDQAEKWWSPSIVGIIMAMVAGALFVCSVHYHWPMIGKMAQLQSDMPSNPLMLKTNFTCNDLLRIEQEIAKWSETIWQFRTKITSEVPVVDMDDEEEVC